MPARVCAARSDNRYSQQLNFPNLQEWGTRYATSDLVRYRRCVTCGSFLLFVILRARPTRVEGFMHRLLAKILYFSLIACTSAALLMIGSASAQTIISGDITGTVTDPTGAAVSAATVTLKSVESGNAQTATTEATGSFRFSLLRPGVYKLQVSLPGFASVEQTVTAAVGQIVTANVRLTVKGSSELVEVTGAAPLLNTESANLSSTFTPKEIEFIPNPGGDLTNYALASPGAVLSTGGGYGNFTVNGMPGTSNLFTINGGDMNDPFSNLNNSGSSNNMLGTNEIQEVAMVSNGYTGQY